MSNGDVDTMMDFWAASLLAHGGTSPFADHNDMLNVIDASIAGDVPWQSFKVTYNGDVPVNNLPNWMNRNYDVWFRDPHVVALNILASPDFAGEMDYVAYHEFNSKDLRVYKDFMSANWSWRHSVSNILIFAEDHSFIWLFRTRLLKTQILMAACLSRLSLAAIRQRSR